MNKQNQDVVGNDVHIVSKSKINTQSGITLIALIITIIILLILAIVNIKLILDGGIITHAKNTTQKYTVEEEKELINLGYSDYKMEKYKKIEITEDLKTLREYFIGKDVNSLVDEEKSTDEIIIFTNGISITSDDYEQMDDAEAYKFYYNGCNYRFIFDPNTAIAKSVEEIKTLTTLTVKGAKVDGNENEGWIIIFEESKNEYYLLARDGEEVTLKEDTVDTGELGEAINVYDYGKEVIGYKSKIDESLVWRVFYEDENNVYLISETSSGDYVKRNFMIYNDEIAKKYTSGANVSNQGRALMPLIKDLFTENKTTPSIRATAYLCDINVWEGYKDEEGRAAWSMGGPTMELFFKSYYATANRGEWTVDCGEDGYGRLH